MQLNVQIWKYAHLCTLPFSFWRSRSHDFVRSLSWRSVPSPESEIRPVHRQACTGAASRRGGALSLGSHAPFLPPQHLETVFLLPVSTSMRLLWTLHINEIPEFLSFCGWHISLSIMSSRFIHPVACDRSSFFFSFFFIRLNNIPLMCI